MGTAVPFSHVNTLALQEPATQHAALCLDDAQVDADCFEWHQARASCLHAHQTHPVHVLHCPLPKRSLPETSVRLPHASRSLVLLCPALLQTPLLSIQMIRSDAVSKTFLVTLKSPNQGVAALKAESRSMWCGLLRIRKAPKLAMRVVSKAQLRKDPSRIASLVKELAFLRTIPPSPLLLHCPCAFQVRCWRRVGWTTVVHRHCSKSYRRAQDGGRARHRRFLSR